MLYEKHNKKLLEMENPNDKQHIYNRRNKEEHLLKLPYYLESGLSHPINLAACHSGNYAHSNVVIPAKDRKLIVMCTSEETHGLYEKTLNYYAQEKWSIYHAKKVDYKKLTTYYIALSKMNKNFLIVLTEKYYRSWKRNSKEMYTLVKFEDVNFSSIIRALKLKRL